MRRWKIKIIRPGEKKNEQQEQLEKFKNGDVIECN